MHGEWDRRHPAELFEDRTACPLESDSVQLEVLAPVIASGLEPETLTNTATVSGGGAPASVSVEDPTLVLSPYAIKSFTSHTTDEAGADYTQAGGHPFQNRTVFELIRTEQLKDATVTLEPGFFGNPAAAARCPIEKIQDPILNSFAKLECPPSSRVGTAFAALGNLGPGIQDRPLYNMVTERGYPAQFAFRIGNTIAVLSVVATTPDRSLRPDARRP